ncbi:hypothetical protein N7495_000638 [Penicillium taxi]|uniref:uncharacterized protein n=1 Tax=Penicillium taxi TaxID=168475 RepID=UPI002545464E|nr:uncharacterized protein N7495_000638 [Penicillium taxi]KAJ5907956.1 hypothetical protein N7495_000638 [Penicillium taxi]
MRVLNHTRRDVIPSQRLPFLFSAASTTIGSVLPSLVARDDSTSTASATETSSGEKPTSNLMTTVLPVVFGAGIPIICAVVILVIFHRRHVKKLSQEDEMDKHRSLDFGMDIVNSKSGKGQQMTHTKGGLSLDIVPYLMPPGIQSPSRDSLHSISRSIDDDKYRPATFTQNDNASIRSYGGSTRFGGLEEPNAGLLGNAAHMSRSSPPIYQSPTNEYRTRSPGGPQQRGPGSALAPSSSNSPISPVERNKVLPVGNQNQTIEPSPLSAEPQFSLGSEEDLHYDSSPHQTDYHEDRPNFPLPDHPLTYPEPVAMPEPEHRQQTQLPRISFPASEVSDYGDERHSEMMVPAVNIQLTEAEDELHMPNMPAEPETPAYDPRRDTRRMTLGVRPLPPDDPTDNPEQRANRIRSFYKEYFDDSKRETTYYEDHGSEVYDGGYVYDPTTGDYFDAAPQAPFAEPIGRRAMTPPPRMPPRFQGGARHMATNSAGFNPGPRAFSSASARPPPGGPRGAPRKMPPPSPLNILPTPHMLKDDSIFMAADFAPSSGFRGRAEGRPETPTGGTMPYSPAFRSHTPLASVFDDLSAMPSPHALRKSGAFTSLDFAPPPRFKNADSGSDAGSIRSNRSAISNTHMNNIRNGNYRVSRLPADMVGTKDDLVNTLRPQMDLAQR